MMTTVTTFKAALLGGAVALAAALPLTAVQADEIMRLDTAQLDSVTAGAAAGVALYGQGTAFGTLSSQTTTTFKADGKSSPVLSTASGSISTFSLATGGTGANKPTATADTQLVGIVGDRKVVRGASRSGSGRGYAYAYDATVAYAASSEFPI